MKKSLLMAFAMFGLLFSAIAQSTVTGTVKDDTGESLPGATVTIKGTTTGTVTDIDGKYSLKVPSAESTLVFSFAGMIPQEIVVGAQSTIDVSLSSSNVLEEVVVVGYGSVDRKKLTSSIVSVSGDAIADKPVASFDQGLAGRAAGVQVNIPSGVLGTAPRIRIRGTNSISSGAQPLIVIDGVPAIDGNGSGLTENNALGDINPADIASYEILKDGAATAIYGSRAANGVILITTKTGKSGEARITYSGQFGVNTVASRFDLLDANEFIRISNEKFATAGTAPQAFPGDNNENTDWQDVIFRSGAVINHNLSISGGNSGTRYYFSAGYMDQEGALERNNLKRYTLRANVDYTGVKWLDAGVKLSLSRQDNEGLNTGVNSLSGNVFNATRAFPNISVFNPNHPTGYNITADNNAMGQGNNLQVIASNLPNIQYVLDNNVVEAINYRTLANVYAQVMPIEGLKLKTQIGFDIADNQDFQTLNGVHGDGQSFEGLVTRFSFQQTRWNWQNTLSYSKTFAEKHNLSVIVGLEYQKSTFDSFFAKGQTFSDPFFLNTALISETYTTQLSGGGYTPTGFASRFGRFNYDYDNRYLLSVSYRNDEISSLPESTRQGSFIGVSAGWNIAAESFFSVDVINTLKLRASYAETGNVNLGAFPYLGTYGPELYGAQTAIRFENVGNPDLRWEVNTKYNIGLDFAILKSRISGSIDYYRNDVTDMVLNAPTPPSFGVPGNSITLNIGAMVNSGIELSLTSLNVAKDGFEWSTTFNLTTNKNEITELSNNNQDIIFIRNINRVGQPVGALFGFQYEGVNAANGNPLYQKADGTIVQGNPDDNTYYVYNAENPGVLGAASSLSENDKRILGQTNPKYFGGLINNIRYKGFDFELALSYAGGNKVMNVTRQENLSMAFANNHKEILNRWTPLNTNTDVPRLSLQNENFLNLNGNTNSRFVEDGDFLRVQNITLGYTLSNEALQAIGMGTIQRIRLFAQVQNAFVFTSYSGLDPELNFSSTTNSQVGIDYNTNPLLRTFTFGISVGL